MAKSKLTKEIISFIIDKYECDTTTYTFPEIAELILEKYKVEVSPQALGKSYRKNKAAVKTVTLNKNSSPKIEKKIFQRSEPDAKPTVDSKEQKGFNDNAGETLSKDEVKNLLD